MRYLFMLAALVVGGCSAPIPAGAGLVQTAPYYRMPNYGTGGQASEPMPVGPGFVQKPDVGPNLGSNQPVPWHPQ